MLRWLLLILICVNTNNLFAQNQSNIQEHSSVVTWFDLITDEDVSDNDPRIKSIIYSTKSYPHSKIIINYGNPNAMGLAAKLAGIFSQHSLLVIRPQRIQLNTANNNKFVQVSIYYKE